MNGERGPSDPAPQTDPAKPSDTAQRDVLESELGMLKVAINKSGDALFLIDKDFRFVYVNDTACRMLDYTREELLRLGPYDIDPDLTNESLERIGADFISSGNVVFQSRHRSRSGRIYPVEVTTSVFMYRGEYISLVLARDITERRQKEEALAQRELEFRRLAENMPDNVARYSCDGRLTYMNPQLERTVGSKAQQLMGKAGGAILNAAGKDPAATQEYLSLVREVASTGVARQFEWVIGGGGGGEKRLSIRLVPERDEAGTIIGVLAIGRDVTEQIRAAEELRRAKEAADAANRAKDRFLAALSHELRTPLTPVLALVSGLETRTDLAEDLRADLKVIHRNVELETKLIDDLLDLTRIQRGKMRLECEVVDAHVVLRAALEICQRDIEAKQQEVTLSLCAKRHHIWADPARVHQVFWNLLRNASKFTPPRGAIRLSSLDREGRLVVEVADNGIGIEPEVFPRIFDAFEQGTKADHFGGLGLGLTVAKTVMDLHHGKLSAFSEGANKGATFTVEFAELVSEPAAAVEASPAAPPMSGGGQRILLVEDNPDTLKILARLLRGPGYQVTPVEGVKAALEAAEREKFDLLVSDIGLGDGTGWDIMRQLKRSHGVRGIAVSGYGTEDDQRQSKDAGFELHIAKPVSGNVLLAAVRQVASVAAPG